MSYQPNANQTEGAVYTQGPVSISGGVRKDTSGPPAGVADGDVHPLLFNEEGRLKVSAQPAIYTATTGNITANGQTVSVDVTRASNLMIHMTTASLAGHNVTFEGSIDGGTTWIAVQVVRTNANTIELTSGVLAATPAYGWEASVNALTNFRVRATAHGSGTATWRFLPGAYATEPIPAIQTHPVTQSGTWNIGTVTPGTAATNLAKARDSAIGATDTGIAILGVRRDTPAAETPIAGDYVVPQVSANGEQWVGMAASATNSPAKARDAVAGASDTAIPAAFVRRDNPTAVTPAAGDYEFAQISSSGEQWVRDQIDLADDAVFTLGTSRARLMSGVSVQTDGTDPTAVSAEGDAAALRTDMNRILLVNQTHPRGATVSADYAAAQTNTSVIAAPGASLSIYITDIQLSNGATAGNVTLLNGSAGTVLWEAYPAINGGAVLNLRQPIKLSANTALCITSTTVTTHSIFIGYYIAP